MMLLLVHLHLRMLLLLILLFATLTCWGMGGLFQRTISMQYRVALLIGEVLIVVTILLEGLLLLGGWHPIEPILHSVYAFMAGLTLPAVWLYTDQWAPHARSLGCSCACIFVCGMLLRTLETGLGPIAFK